MIQLVDHVTFIPFNINLNSASAMEVGSLAQELQDNIGSTNMIQQQVTESLALLEDSVQETEEHIEQVGNIINYLQWFSNNGAIISSLMKMQQKSILHLNELKRSMLMQPIIFSL